MHGYRLLPRSIVPWGGSLTRCEIVIRLAMLAAPRTKAVETMLGMK